MKNKLISVVVSVYNEELSLGHFYEVTGNVLAECNWDYELIFVNDGSADASMVMLREFANQNPRVKVVNFSRNFGHEAAMIAGVDYAAGDAVICMDADLQHPPESIPAILEKFDEGYDVISMIRTSNADAGFLHKLATGGFYKVLNMLSPVKFEENSSDFFAFSKRVANVLKGGYRENVRYLRGFVQSVGFKKTTLEFEARNREAGESKYNFRKLLIFSLNTLCSFSDMPLKLGIVSGVVVALLGVVLMIYTIIKHILTSVPAGYSTIIVALCFMFAITLVIIGIIGQYIAVLFAEVKGRPVYIVQEVVNGTDETGEPLAEPEKKENHEGVIKEI